MAMALLQPRLLKRYCVSGRQYELEDAAGPADVSAYLDKQMSMHPVDMFFISWTSVTAVSENCVMLTHPPRRLFQTGETCLFLTVIERTVDAFNQCSLWSPWATAI